MSLNHNIDKGYIDQSWENMSQILDREMPQKKDSRKWLLIFLAIGLLGLATWWVRADAGKAANISIVQSEEVPNTKEQSSKAAVVVEDVVEEKMVNQGEAVVSKEELSGYVAKEKGYEKEEIVAKKVSNLSNNGSDNPLSKSTGINGQISYSGTPVTVNTNQHTRPTQASVEVKNTTINETQNIVSTNLNHSEIVAQSTKRTNVQFGLLTSLGLGSLNSALRNPPVLPMVIKPSIVVVKKWNPWAFSIAANGAYITEEAYFGAGSDLRLNYKLNRQIGLSLGGGITKWSNSGVSFHEEISDITDVGLGSFESKVYTIFPSNKWDVHGSLGAFYNIFPLLSINGGVRYRQEFSKKYESNDAYSAAINEDSANAEMVGFNRYEENRTKPFINPYIGLEIKVFKNLSLQSQLEFKRKSADLRSDKPLLISGGLSYNF